MAETVKILVSPNVRYFHDTDSDLELQAGIVYELPARPLKSLQVRGALRDGRLRVVEGHLEFAIKSGRVIIDGVPGGNIFITVVDAGHTEEIWFAPKPVVVAEKSEAKPIIPVKKAIPIEPVVVAEEPEAKPVERKKRK